MDSAKAQTNVNGRIFGLDNLYHLSLSKGRATMRFVFGILIEGKREEVIRQEVTIRVAPDNDFQQKIDMILDMLALSKEREIALDINFAGLVEDVAAVRTAVDTTRNKLIEAIERLSDNVTPDQIAAVRSTLTTIASDLNVVNTTIDSIDPNVEGGSVPGDGSVPPTSVEGSSDAPVEGEAPSEVPSEGGEGVAIEGDDEPEADGGDETNAVQ